MASSKPSAHSIYNLVECEWLMKSDYKWYADLTSMCTLTSTFFKPAHVLSAPPSFQVSSKERQVLFEVTIVDSGEYSVLVVNCRTA